MAHEDYFNAHFFDMAVDNPTDVRFYLHHALRAGEALEIGAGTGRLAIPIAEQGIPVWCIEPSEAMLAACLVKIMQKPQVHPYITVVPGAAADFDLERQFRLIYAHGIHTHILTDDQHRSLLDNIARHLKSDGVFIFDMLNLDPSTWTEQPITLYKQQCIGEITYRTLFGREMTGKDTCRYITVYETTYPDGFTERVREQTRGRFLTREQMLSFLSDAGFVVEQEYAGSDFSPYNGGDRIIMQVRVRR
jgi:SAM-dependent methyltransferase